MDQFKSVLLAPACVSDAARTMFFGTVGALKDGSIQVHVKESDVSKWLAGALEQQWPLLGRDLSGLRCILTFLSEKEASVSARKGKASSLRDEVQQALFEGKLLALLEDSGTESLE